MRAATRWPGEREEPGNPSRWISFAAIALLHAVALWGLMQIESVRQAMHETVMMASLVAPPPPNVVPPEVPPPSAPPLAPRPRVIATAAPATSTITAPPPEEAPEPVTAELPPPAPVAVVAAPEPAIVPPNFIAAYLDNPPPRYPPASRTLKEQGRVILRVMVSPEGAAADVTVEHSSGFDRLDRAALEAVRRWKFVPAKQGDRPVAAAVLVPLVFDLRNA